MLTTQGKMHIKRYLAQYTSSIAQSVAFGIGNTAESAGDVSLNFETARSTVNLITYDFVTDSLVYKASVPDNYSGKIHEVGLYSLETNPVALSYGSRMVTTFDPIREDWVDPIDGVTAATFTTANTRVGSGSVSFTPAASATMTETLRNINLDFSGNSAADSMVFAFNVGNANTDAVAVRFMTDAANYYTFNIGASVQSAGYKIVEIPIGAATVAGVPDWEDITEIQVAVTSKAAGASVIDLDAIRVEDRDSNNLDYILVARKVLATPVTKIEGQPQDLEFTLNVSI